MTDIDLKLLPYLIYCGNQTILISDLNDTKINYIINNKLSKIEEITYNIMNPDFLIKSYYFDTNTLVINLKLSLKHNENIEDIEDKLYKYFGNSNQLIGEYGPDTWMESNISLINKNEIDNKSYEFGISPLTIKIHII